MFLFLVLFLILVIFIYFLKNPTYALTPYNLIIENLYEKKVFYSELEKKSIFPTSEYLEKYWLDIRREYMDILKNDNYNNNNVGKKYITQSEDFWKGWETLPLRMFGKDTEYMNKCPTLKKYIGDDVPTAFFSIIEPGKIIHSHYGPFKGILRYHLGLSIPPKDSGQCFISVDGETYDWKEGEGVLFDESYKHFVYNDTNYYRVILFLDVKRPLDSPLNIINDFLLSLMSIY